MVIEEDMKRRLRHMALNGASVRNMIDEIRRLAPSGDNATFPVVYYFWKAFHLPLGQVRDLEGSAYFSGAVSQEDIERLMLPRIESTRDRWAAE